MASSDEKSLSDFARTALALNSDFDEFERLSVQLERLSIETDNGFEQAKKLLARFGECGMRIGDGVTALTQALESAKSRAEVAMVSVAKSAEKVRQRQIETNQMLERFQALAEKAKKVTESLPVQQPEGASLTEIDTQLEALGSEMEQLKLDASAAHMTGLARNADSMNQSLDSARRKLGRLQIKT